MRIAAAPIELNPSQRPDAAGIDKAAREFEGLFAQMMIKSMRDAGFGDALFPGENQAYRDMYDQQLAQSLTAGRGLGLAEVIARQLGQNLGLETGSALDTRLQGSTGPVAIPLAAAGATPSFSLQGVDPAARASSEHAAALASRTTALAAAAGEEERSPMDAFVERLMARARPAVEAVGAVGETIAAIPGKVANAVADALPDGLDPRSPEGFVAKVWPHAQRAAEELGVDPRALVAQAALETGWGRRQIQRGDGASANNLFGIKATGWKGERATVSTHEYRNGVRQSERADFRAYASPAESFADYVRLLKKSPRYAQALEAGRDVRAFAQGLQRAGYATDPSYADKITAISNGPTLGRALAKLAGMAANR